MLIRSLRGEEGRGGEGRGGEERGQNKCLLKLKRFSDYAQ